MWVKAAPLPLSGAGRGWREGHCGGRARCLGGGRRGPLQRAWVGGRAGRRSRRSGLEKDCPPKEGYAAGRDRGRGELTAEGEAPCGMRECRSERVREKRGWVGGWMDGCSSEVHWWED